MARSINLISVSADVLSRTAARYVIDIVISDDYKYYWPTVANQGSIAIPLQMVGSRPH